jgi:hypothetical protein
MTPVIRMSKTTSMAANTIDTVTVTSRDHNYRWLLNGRRGQGEFPGTDDPYFSGFDLVVDLNPCYVGDVLSFAYEMRPATSTRVATAVPIYEREKYIPADDDGGKPLLAFDPLSPINGVAGQIDILEVF